jgi:hypothetical protein
MWGLSSPYRDTQDLQGLSGQRWRTEEALVCGLVEGAGKLDGAPGGVEGQRGRYIWSSQIAWNS